jgi:hypothetical protein
VLQQTTGAAAGGAIFTRLLRHLRDLHAVFTPRAYADRRSRGGGSVPTLRVLAAASAVLVASACSAPSSSSTPSPAPTPSSAASTAAPGSPGSAATCPDGAYLLTAFEGRGQASAVGKGTGGDIAVDFSSGTFTISSDGAQPVKLDLGRLNAEMRFNGQISGTAEGDPAALRLTTTAARGDVAVKGLGVSHTYPVDGVADQLIGQGATAQATCDDAAGTAVVVLPNATLTLTRAGR